MCGIVGILSLRQGRSPEDAVLRRMTDLQAHRGPDSEGFFRSGPVALGHRRLSIIDLSSGDQPMSTADGQLTVVFNGEIYNFQELRADLEGKGHRFGTRSDTEVLLHSYREWGEDCVRRFNGMFAFALWDEKNRRVFAARDRFGKKPFFYYQDREVLLFASEMKSILAYPGVSCDVDPTAIDDYFSCSYIPAPRTIYRQIRKLEPAHILVHEKGETRVSRYWKIAFTDANHGRPEEDLLEELGSRLRDSVRLRMISDVPLGAFLSGGLDSSAIVATMAELSSRPVKTFTIGFEEAGFSEVEDARKVARLFGTDHEEFVVRLDAAEVLPEIVWHLEEPFGDSSALPTYYVAKMAAQRVKVVLSGDGGDELFGGYRRYLEALGGVRWAAIPGPVRRKVLLPLALRLPLATPGRNFLFAVGAVQPDAPGYRLGLYPYIKDGLYRKEFREALRGHNPFGDTDASLAEAARYDPVSRLQYLDINDYLHNDILVKVDRMSMAHSMELRSPLLDYRLMEFVASIPPGLRIADGVTKVIFRKHLKGVLPPESMAKKKQGFGIPAGLWFRKGLNRFARDVLFDGSCFWKGYLRPDVLRRVVDGHEKGERDYSVWIWCLLVLELWHRRFAGSIRGGTAQAEQ